MLDFTPEERKVTLFLLSLALCGLILNNLAKTNCRIEKIIHPPMQLAKLNLNKIGLAELAATKSVSIKLAQRILERRDLRKKFNCLEELKEVKGIGDQRYEKLKELFFVE